MPAAGQPRRCADTPLGVTAMPSHQVEDAETSSVMTIIEVEFPGQAEKKVRIGSEELYRRCGVNEGLLWLHADINASEGPEIYGESAVKLDNNGNGFVIAFGYASCRPGSSLIEADLEEEPFTTVTTVGADRVGEVDEVFRSGRYWVRTGPSLACQGR